MYMHHTPKELALSVHALYPIGLVSHATVCMWQRISLYSPQHWAHGTILKSVCVCVIKYTSLHVEMHEFIFNRDAYDVVIEKVVVGYHSLMRLLNLYSWPKNCGVCVWRVPAMCIRL